MDVGDILVEFRRTGGRAGNDEHLVVSHDGQATLRTPDSIQRLELGPATVEQLGQQLAAAGFTELPEDLRSLPDQDEPQPDVVEYTITADDHTVRALGVRFPRSSCPWSRR